MKILTDAGSKSLCDCTPNSLKKYSTHDITFCTEFEINDYNWNDFDIVHVNGTICEQFFTTKAKTIYNIHAYILSCPPGGLYCMVLNKFLKEPLTCLDCLGYLGIKTGTDHQKKLIKMAQKADIFAVHSEYMKEFYHMFNPTVFTVPLETDILIPCNPKEKELEEYLLYTGRLSFEKNPFGFIDIVNRTGIKGKMVVYNFLETDELTNTKSFYKDLINNTNPNIEIILNPSKGEMIKLVQRAKFTVLPYFFAEPLGVAALNSILCGTPVISFPYGNARNLSTLLPKTLDEMIKMLNVSDNEYKNIISKMNAKKIELIKIHDPATVVKQWDNIYDKLGESL